jgi:hypothetical protein
VLSSISYKDSGSGENGGPEAVLPIFRGFHDKSPWNLTRIRRRKYGESNFFILRFVPNSISCCSQIFHCLVKTFCRDAFFRETQITQDIVTRPDCFRPEYRHSRCVFATKNSLLWRRTRRVTEIPIGVVRGRPLLSEVSNQTFHIYNSQETYCRKHSPSN